MLVCDDYRVVLHDEEAQNPHILILGKSGTGKTVLMRELADEYEERNDLYVVLDVNGSWIPGHTDTSVRKIEIAKDGLLLPFNGSEFESGKFAEILARAFGLKKKDKLEDFYAAAMSVCQVWIKNASQLSRLWCENREIPLSAIAGEITNPEFEVMEAARKGLLRLGIPSPFLLADRKTAVWHLDFSDVRESQKTILAECVLQLIYCRAQAGRIWNELHIFVDEFQQFQFPPESAFYQILTEGRKHRIGLCMATQFVKDAFGEKKVHQLEQAAMSFYFQPSQSEISGIARELSRCGVEVSECAHALANLHRGECIMIAPHSVGNSKVILECPRKVQVCTENI